MAQRTAEQSQRWCPGKSKTASQGATEALACSSKVDGEQVLMGQVSPGLLRAHASLFGLFSLLGCYDYES